MIKNLYRNFSFFLFLAVIVLLMAGCPEETLDAPTGLTATATGKIITLAWNAVKGAVSYAVLWFIYIRWAICVYWKY